MKKPATPTDEPDRLEALRRYDVLDTKQEAPFDELTRLVAATLGVPISLISLVDSDRQWFKSKYGLEVTQTPRDVSFCAHVVAEREPLEVPDALKDARFSDNPLVTGAPHIRFYAGMPLLTNDGFIVGTLCAIDHKPRVLTPQQRQIFALLANQVIGLLEMRRERKEIIAARAASLEATGRLQVLFDVMAEGVVVQDAEGRITSSNAAASRFFGLTADQLGGRTSTDPRWRAVHEDGSDFPGEMQPSMTSLRTATPTINVVMGIQVPDVSETRWLSVNAQPIFPPDKMRPHGVITTFHDITPLKTAQQRIARQERLVTTGTLAAGVGHEINNPLAFILSNVEFSLEELRAIAGGSPSARLRELIAALSEARDGVDRIRKIVRGLRALAREDSEVIPTDLSAVVDTAVNIAAHELRGKASVIRQLELTPPVLADESRLTQVLVNLIVNAAQAFTTKNFDQNTITLTSRTRRENRVELSVADNGPGMTEAVLARIFDPFFTTKPVGEGTGLGLSISRSIITALGGELTVESAVGKGTTFTLSVPAAQQLLGEQAVAVEQVASQRGRVLLIDDEPALLASFKRVLERDHDIVVLADPRLALAALKATAFDVVFCDLMMPHLSGAELYEQVRGFDPHLAQRFVFVTGGATSAEAQRFLDETDNERLEKPFNLQNLRGIARRFVEARIGAQLA